MSTKRKVLVQWMGRDRSRTEVTCDCGRVFIIYTDDTVCECGQHYNLFGSKLVPPQLRDWDQDDD